uniref:Heat shock protein 70 n=1 Tax=Panagrolaimus sp. ES5 TaxID=591445 RepID=A0AC34F434_9BILA
MGIHPESGELSYYNESEKKTVNLKISIVDPNKNDLIFEEIKAKINGELGCVCIYLFNSYSNVIRKKFVEEGLNFGFKNIEIINWETAVYLNVLSQTIYKPLNGNVIWIHCDKSIFVWKVNEQKSKFIGQWNKGDIFKLEDLQKIMDESKLKQGPDVLLYYNSDYIDKEIFKKIFTSVQFYSYNYDIRYFASNSSLLRARITSGDLDLIHLDTENFLTKKSALRIKGKNVVSFEKGQKLPIVYSKTTKKESVDDALEIQFNYHKELIQFPDYDNLKIDFHVNLNEIYTVHFTPLSKEDDSESALEKNIGSEKAENKTNDNFNNCYLIPKKDILLTSNFQAIGIDLGTSRCCAAVNRVNGIQVIPLDYTGERLLPSYVSYDEKNVKCGKIVIHRLRNHWKSTIFDTKRIIGRNLIEFEIDENWSFIVSENETRKVVMEIDGFNGKQKITAEQVATELLKYIKQKAEEFQGTKITKAVITVPATFTESQKTETITAAKFAGWSEIELLPEPIAAAFAYFINRSVPNNSTVLLFDLGGGTLDVCIFKVENDMIKILSNIGDSKLGGRNFDTVLINFFQHNMNANYDITLLKDKKYKLMLEGQKIKEDLTTVISSWLDIDEFDPNQNGIISITQEEFQRMTQPLINKIRNTIQSALYDSKLNANQINQVLHVGGGSRMPIIKELLKEMFSESEHCCEEHPDEVVAIGAAYYAYKIFSEQ